MSTNDNCGMVIFRWLVTIMSLVIALPAMFDPAAQTTFILTSCVFIFSKFVDNMEGISKHRVQFHTGFCMIGSAVGAIAIGFCFYYFAAIFNETQFVASGNTEMTADMEKYPLFGNGSFYVILFCALMFYLFEETLFGGFELYKYFNTKKKLSLRKARKLKVLNI